MKVGPGDRVASISVIDANAPARGDEPDPGRNRRAAANGVEAAEAEAPPAPKAGRNGHQPPPGRNGKK
jgi:hypothetical protein